MMGKRNHTQVTLHLHDNYATGTQAIVRCGPRFPKSKGCAQRRVDLGNLLFSAAKQKVGSSIPWGGLRVGPGFYEPDDNPPSHIYNQSPPTSPTNYTLPPYTAPPYDIVIGYEQPHFAGQPYGGVRGLSITGCAFFDNRLAANSKNNGSLLFNHKDIWYGDSGSTENKTAPVAAIRFVNNTESNNTFYSGGIDYIPWDPLQVGNAAFLPHWLERFND